MPSPRHMEPPAHRAELSPVAVPSSSRCSNPALLKKLKGVHRAGKPKLSYKNGIGRYRTQRCTVRKCVSHLCCLDRAFLPQTLQHITLSFCFLYQPSEKKKNQKQRRKKPLTTKQTFHTAQLSQVSFPDVLMFQEVGSCSQRCSYCFQSIMVNGL